MDAYILSTLRFRLLLPLLPYDGYFYPSAAHSAGARRGSVKILYMS